MFDLWRDFIHALPPFAQLVVGVACLTVGVGLLLTLSAFKELKKIQKIEK